MKGNGRKLTEREGKGRAGKARGGNERYLVEPVRIDDYNFKKETLYLSFTATITTRLVGSINMSRNRRVNVIVLYGTEMFNKSVRSASARFTDVKFATFNARNAVNDVGGGACKIAE